MKVEQVSCGKPVEASIDCGALVFVTCDEGCKGRISFEVDDFQCIVLYIRMHLMAHWISIEQIPEVKRFIEDECDAARLNAQP